jgi:hypothetical protein
VAIRHFSIFENSYGSLRCWFRDAAETGYEFKVSSKIIRDAWSEGGPDRVRTLHENAPNVHLRIGLANPWDNEGEWPEQRAYAMVNGLVPCYS